MALHLHLNKLEPDANQLKSFIGKSITNVTLVYYVLEDVKSLDWIIIEFDKSTNLLISVGYHAENIVVMFNQGVSDIRKHIDYTNGVDNDIKLYETQFYFEDDPELLKEIFFTHTHDIEFYHQVIFVFEKMAIMVYAAIELGIEIITINNAKNYLNISCKSLIIK